MNEASNAINPLGTYREKGQGLRREFTLYSDKVSVRGYRIGGNEFAHHVHLDGLQPDIGILQFRSRRCYVGMMLSVALGSFLWLFVGPFDLPWTSTRVFITAILLTASLVWAVAYFPRYIAYRFGNLGGLVVLDVIEAGPEKARCREFAENISQAIRDKRQLTIPSA